MKITYYAELYIPDLDMRMQHREPVKELRPTLDLALGTSKLTFELKRTQPISFDYDGNTTSIVGIYEYNPIRAEFKNES